ncbi:chaplin [Streptomyces sp. NPDC093084]|uniref:chaplin n=1 Tax=Streptomyces sp. NPDC093084 TaxID=3155197 RepID=UPI003432A8AE
MKRVTRNGVIAVAAASGAMAMAVPSWADSGADGTAAGSPGVISGNGIQLPVHVPVSVCGNTVNVVGLLNPSAGNTCANVGGSTGDGKSGSSAASGTAATGGTSGGKSGGTSGGSSATTGGGASARGAEEDSPGLLSGNGIQLPVDLPVNVSGNSVNVVGALNPAIGNTSVNTSGEHPSTPETPAPEPPSTPPVKAHPAPKPVEAVEPPASTASLAHTGAGLTGAAAAGSAALLLAGTVLHRRFRPDRTR